MVKPIELKKGAIIEEEGKSYIIMGVKKGLNDRTIYISLSIFLIPVKRVECRYCKGTLFKQGTRKGQYLCSDCNRLNYLNENGEHEEA